MSMLGPDAGASSDGTSGARPKALPNDDLEHVGALAHDVFTELDGARVLITGASGFLGSWMAETLAWAAVQLDIDLRATLLVRDPRRFEAAFPHLACNSALELQQGAIGTMSLPGADLTHVIHAAAPVVHRRLPDSPGEAFDAVVAGTRRLLEVSAARGARRFLFISSGAVYGPQPPGLERIGEDFGGAPDPTNPTSVYGEAKRAAELMCALAAHDGTLETVIARGFAFVGPRLPLDASFAVGNFLADGMAGRSIRVAGDGTPWRSYLYAADAAVWLWTMLIRGASGRAYNLGSGDPCTIRQLAGEVGALWNPEVPVVVEGRGEVPGLASRYIPSIDRVVRELGLTVQIPRAEALRRTLQFHAVDSEEASR